LGKTLIERIEKSHEDPLVSSSTSLHGFSFRKIEIFKEKKVKIPFRRNSQPS
jgi:hypothetical protein